MDVAATMVERVFDFCYGMAMFDATRRTAVASDKDAYLKNDDMRDAVCRYVDRIFARPDEVDARHAIEEVKRAVGDEAFTIGNSQKLVNMSAKYLYIATYGNPALRQNFRRCDCPMDNVMIKAVIGKMRDLESSLTSDGEYARLTSKRETREGKMVKWTVFLQQPWSKMGLGKGDVGAWVQYELFQDIVRFLIARCPGNGFMPIEFDYINFE